MTVHPITAERKQVGKSIKVDSKHRVFYRATQIEYSAPCYKRPPLEVGMRVAILETRSEFTGTIPEPIWSAATVAKIGEGSNPLVTFEYEDQSSVKALTAAMDQIAQFCIVLPKKRSRKTRRQE